MGDSARCGCCHSRSLLTTRRRVGWRFSILQERRTSSASQAPRCGSWPGKARALRMVLWIQRVGIFWYDSTKINLLLEAESAEGAGRNNSVKPQLMWRQNASNARCNGRAWARQLYLVSDYCCSAKTDTHLPGSASTRT